MLRQKELKKVVLYERDGDGEGRRRMRDGSESESSGADAAINLDFNGVTQELSDDGRLENG